MPKSPVIRSFFAKNGLTMVIVILMAAFIIGGLQGLNYLAKNKIEKDDNLKVNTISKENKTARQIVQDFLNYCNTKDVSSASALLTLECKENEEILTTWVEKNFRNSKTFKIESETINKGIYNYKIKITDNILVTGKIDENLLEISMAVVNEKGEYKVSILNNDERSN